MDMHCKKILLTILLLVCGFSGVCGGAEIVLKTAPQASFPKYYTNANELHGLCAEIMMELDAMDPQIKFQCSRSFVPFKRLQMYLEQGELDVFFGMRKTVQRQEKFVFATIPLYQINYVIAIRTGDDTSIKSLQELSVFSQKHLVLSVAGTAVSRFLQRADVVVDDHASTPSRALKKLLAGRGSCVVYHDLGLKNIIRRDHLEDRVTILPVTLLTYSHYVAFAKTVAPSTIAIVDNDLHKMRDNGVLDEIALKYQLN